MLRIVTPFKVPRAEEARRAAGKAYWAEAKRRAMSPAYQRAIKMFAELNVYGTRTGR